MSTSASCCSAGFVLATGVAQLTREPIALRHEVVGRDRQQRLGSFGKSLMKQRAGSLASVYSFTDLRSSDLQRRQHG